MFTSCVQAVSEEKISITRTDKHENITWDLIELVENDEELKELLEKSIQKAKELNPDPDTNPVVDLAAVEQPMLRLRESWNTIGQLRSGFL